MMFADHDPFGELNEKYDIIPAPDLDRAGSD